MKIVDSNRGVKNSCWSPSAWNDGSRKSAFQPYRPTTVLTNLQRGNMPTETASPEEHELNLHIRAGQGEIREVDLKTDVDTRDENGLTPLMWAASYGQLNAVRILISHGANVCQRGFDGETPLLLASAGGHHDVVRYLLNHGANVCDRDNFGNTTLMLACYGDHPHSTNELLLRGADILTTNDHGDSAFGIAIARRATLAQAVIENFLLTLLC